MIETEQTALSAQSCRQRLARSRRGFLACTLNALPTILPVEIRAQDGQLLLVLPASADAERLVGQVVAVSVGKRAFRYCKGWTVVARGRLGEPSQGALPLELAQLDGATFDRPTNRRSA